MAAQGGLMANNSLEHTTSEADSTGKLLNIVFRRSNLDCRAGSLLHRDLTDVVGVRVTDGQASFFLTPVRPGSVSAFAGNDCLLKCLGV